MERAPWQRVLQQMGCIVWGVGGTLRTALAQLQPEPMSREGIVECLRYPELTAAWLEYVRNPVNLVAKPAAYLRRAVQRGKYPPLGLPERSVDETLLFAAVPHPGCGYGRGRPPASTTPGALAYPASLAVVPPAATRWPLDAS